MVSEKGNVEEEWQMLKMCGMRRVGGGMRKESERWCEDVSVAVS